MERDPARLRALADTRLSAVPDVAFDRFARMARTYLGVPTALVSLVDGTRQFFPGAAGLAEPAAVERQTPLSHSICRYVVASGAPIVAADVRAVETLRDSLAVAELGVVAYAGMPLTDAAGNVLGSLCAIDTEPRSWTDAEVEMLRDLAAACSCELQLRIAAERAGEVQQQMDQAVRRLQLAADATSVFASLDVPSAMRRLSELLVPQFADWVLLALAGEDGGVGELAYAHRDGQQRRLSAYAACLAAAGPASPLIAVLDGGRAVLHTSVDRALLGRLCGDRQTAQLAEELGCASMLVVPLRARGRNLGAVLLASGTDRAFDGGDLAVALDLGARAGLAIDNGRLYAGQRRVAETLQRSMLTRLPEPDHLEIASRYRASSDDAQVGGDWYDAFQQPDGGTVLVIGDVMGHDIRAAGSMGQLRNLLRGTAYDCGDGPARVLSRVDAAIRGLRVDALATCLVARIEQPADLAAEGGRTLRWSNAGHPPAVLLHPDGSVTVLGEEPDLMLGVDPGSERRDHVTPLPAGGVLLLFTDGLVEHRLRTLEEGLALVVETVRRQRDAPLEELCDAVLAALAGDDTTDDVALIAVRPHAESGPRPVEAGPTDAPDDRPTG